MVKVRGLYQRLDWESQNRGCSSQLAYINAIMGSGTDTDTSTPIMEQRLYNPRGRDKDGFLCRLM